MRVEERKAGRQAWGRKGAEGVCGCACLSGRERRRWRKVGKDGSQDVGVDV